VVALSFIHQRGEDSQAFFFAKCRETSHPLVIWLELRAALPVVGGANSQDLNEDRRLKALPLLNNVILLCCCHISRAFPLGSLKNLRVDHWIRSDELPDG
jgi:hypothetical protein